MTRWLLAALFAGTTLLTGPAAAVEVEPLVGRLQEDPVQVDPRSEIRIDDGAVRSALEDLPVPTYVVVLPQSQVDREDGGVDGVLLRVVEALDDPRAVVVVVTDQGELQAGEGGSSGVEASALLDRIVHSRSDQEFNGQTLTQALLAFAEAVERQGQEGGERGLTSAGPNALALAALVGLAVAAGGLLWARSQRRVREQAPRPEGDTLSGGW